MRVPLQLGMAALIAAFVTGSASAQSQPLGDVARQQQLQKQQSPAPQKVITNEDIPASSPQAGANPGEPGKTTETTSSKKAEERPDAGAVRAKISAQKQKVKELEDRIAADKKQLAKHDRTEEIAHGTGMGTTIALHVPDYCDMPDYMQEERGYKDWCDEPNKLQAEVDDLQKQLDSERATLDAMQEEARQQSFGNSVYDPD